MECASASLITGGGETVSAAATRANVRPKRTNASAVIFLFIRVSCSSRCANLSTDSNRRMARPPWDGRPGFLVHLAFSPRHSSLIWPRLEAAPRRSCILCDAVAKRPILLRHFQKIHEDVFGPDAGVLGQKLGDAREESLLFVGPPRVVDGDLNDHEIIVAGDPQIIFAIEKIAFVVFV